MAVSPEVRGHRDSAPSMCTAWERQPTTLNHRSASVLGRVQEVLTDLNSSPELIRIQLSIIMGLDRAELQAGASLQFAAAPAAGDDCGETRQSRGGRPRSSQLEAGGWGRKPLCLGPDSRPVWEGAGG
ncbi:unnamed protein product [Rangifer tarandus platyrhynchus]|uniref:Uncharacterized protein n=1 Tax=Rangifer tarandus platyrhynchus TaxID=3082113 RepID=A0AC59YAS3_RANTA